MQTPLGGIRPRPRRVLNVIKSDVSDISSQKEHQPAASAPHPRPEGHPVFRPPAPRPPAEPASMPPTKAPANVTISAPVSPAKRPPPPPTFKAATHGPSGDYIARSGFEALGPILHKELQDAPLAAEEPPSAFFSQDAPSSLASASRQKLPPKPQSATSPVASGEALFTAADRAADFINDRLKGTLSFFTSSRDRDGLSSPSSSPKSDNGFDEIMANLKKHSTPLQSSSSALASDESIDKDIRMNLAGLSLESPRSASPKSESSPEPTTPKSPPPVTVESRATSIASPVQSPIMQSSTIFKHGLSALEKIGKTTAEVVVGTRNRLLEQPQAAQSSFNPSLAQPVTPDFTDTSQSFIQICQLYGGIGKFQEIQIKSLRAAIKIKLLHETNVQKRISYDQNWRREQMGHLAGALHPDLITATASSLSSQSDLNLHKRLAAILSTPDAEANFDCVRRLLRSLDSVLVETSSVEETISCNRRRHILCQIFSLLCDVFTQTVKSPALAVEGIVPLASELCLLTAFVSRSLQDNFNRCCDEAAPQADADQSTIMQLLLDLAYSFVPQLQALLFSFQ